MNNEKQHRQQLPAYIEGLQSKGNYWFYGRSIRDALGLSEGAIKAALWRMEQKHAICRIRGDFYVIVPPEHRVAGCLPAIWFIDPLMAYLDLPYYVALLSAASMEGAAHQQVMRLQVMTTKPLRNVIAGNQNIQFHYKPSIDRDDEFLAIKKTPLSYFKISSPELTAYDLIRYANGMEQLQQAATVIAELTEKLDVKLLAKAINEETVMLTSAQRLGYLLEHIIHTNRELNDLEIAINQRKPRYIPLISGRTTLSCERNKRWHILVDALIELDDL